MASTPPGPPPTTRSKLRRIADGRASGSRRRRLDSSKIGRSALSSICALPEIDEFITDVGASAERLEPIAGGGRRGGAGLMHTLSEPRFVAVSTNPAIDRVARIEGAPTGVVRRVGAARDAGRQGHPRCMRCRRARRRGRGRHHRRRQERRRALGAARRRAGRRRSRAQSREPRAGPTPWSRPRAAISSRCTSRPDRLPRRSATASLPCSRRIGNPRGSPFAAAFRPERQSTCTRG